MLPECNLENGAAKELRGKDFHVRYVHASLQILCKVCDMQSSSREGLQMGVQLMGLMLSSEAHVLHMEDSRFNPWYLQLEMGRPPSETLENCC